MLDSGYWLLDYGHRSIANKVDDKSSNKTVVFPLHLQLEQFKLLIYRPVGKNRLDSCFGLESAVFQILMIARIF